LRIPDRPEYSLPIANYFHYNDCFSSHPARVAKLVDARDLNLSTQTGNPLV